MATVRNEEKIHQEANTVSVSMAETFETMTMKNWTVGFQRRRSVRCWWHGKQEPLLEMASGFVILRLKISAGSCCGCSCDSRTTGYINKQQLEQRVQTQWRVYWWRSQREKKRPRCSLLLMRIWPFGENKGNKKRKKANKKKEMGKKEIGNLGCFRIVEKKQPALCWIEL